ncbi:cation-translocating P-type ATPase [Micromonospora pattaloongensis]|uniref:cation-translocating P-type ATPase n=1 Tax=Micromonospora pattaloongensis TaxID=405436 RepID=UPI000B81679A|nr:cation-transporting P-type ATPase [Micromonospora pattaloongensis]
MAAAADFLFPGWLFERACPRHAATHPHRLGSAAPGGRGKVYPTSEQESAKMAADQAQSPPAASATATTAELPPRLRASRHRHAWAGDGYAHIEVRCGPGELCPQDAARLEQAVEAADGVRWAAWNGALRRVVVSFDPARVRLADLVAAVETVEGRDGRIGEPAEGSPDVDPAVRDAVSLAGDLIGAGVGLAGRALRLPAVPAELAALTAAFEIPRLRRRLRRVLGTVRADLGLALASSAIAAASQRPLASLTDAALRVGMLAETAAYRDAWARRAPELHRDRESSRASAPAVGARPRPLPGGPIEQFAERISTVTLLAGSALLPLSGKITQAARAVTTGSPHGAHLGRQAYAAQLGRVLARRGVIVRDPEPLRRLDRVDTVIIEASALTTGRSVVTHVVPVRGTAEDARARATELLERDHGDAGSPARWRLTAPSALEAPLPAEAMARLDEIGAGRGDVLALAEGTDLVALLRVEIALDPLAPALAAAARRVGRLLIAGLGSQVGQRVHADGSVAGGSRLADSVRTTQRDGHGVLLIAARNDAALAAADCGIGILSDGRRPPWGAHLLSGPGLENAWLALEATTLARHVSGRSVRLSLLGSAAGALLGLFDTRPQAGRNALLAGGVAALANLANGVWAAQRLARRPLPVPDDVVPWHALSVDDVLHTLETSTAGLSDAEAAKRRDDQIDEPADGEERGLLTATLDGLNTPLTAPLAAGAGVSAASGSPVDAVLVLAVILANALLSGAQEVTAGRALRQLLTAAAVQVRLIRPDGVRQVPAEQLVPGDLLALEPGDAVPADCRLIEAAGLEMDESNLTGESVPVRKTVTPSLAAAVADRNSMVYAGTTVAAGTGAAVVVATGRSTEAGRSAHGVTEEAPGGGVHARLQKLTSATIPAAVAAAAGVLGSGLLRGRVAESMTSSVALAVAAMPEGLPFVATAAQLSASKRLARHDILVRDPRAMEALGRVDVICFDKTGTLTHGRIGLHSVSDGRRAEPAARLGPAYREVLAAALRATPQPDGDEPLPHPTDHAVLTGARDAGVDTGDGAPGWRVLGELPFEPGRGFHAVLGRLAEAGLITVKGAPEIVLPRCGAWRRDGRSAPLTEADRDGVHAEVERMARQGLRVLAVAERRASARDDLDDGRVERLELCGLLGLADPPRETAPEAVRRLRDAGVTVVMLTGDHPSTAEAIAGHLGLLDGGGVAAEGGGGGAADGGGVVTGARLDDADRPEFDAMVGGARVFARVSPAHKVAVVRALRRLGHVVGVTGDGANDAPAIRLADVGIALGGHGTTAARQAADMIVADSRIETIADGVIEARAMWVAVRDALSLLLGGNLGEIMFTLGSSVVAARQPLNARQLLFVNLLTDLLPAITVAVRPPRHVTAEALTREGPDASLGSALSRDVARRATATAVATTGSWLLARFTGTRTRASSVALASLVASQLGQTVVASRGDPVVLAAAGVSMAALVGAVQTPVVSRFFSCRPLGPVGWGIVLGSAATATALAAVPLPFGQPPGRTGPALPPRR